MINSIKRLWNFRAAGIVKVSAILTRIVYLNIYEKTSSFFWKYNLEKCGRNVTIQKSTIIRHPVRIQLGDNVSVGRNCQISTEFDDSYLHIGANTHIDKMCLLDFSGGVSIGQYVTISENVMIETHSHGFSPRSRPEKMPLVIHDNVWIGARAVILPNVEFIGENAIVGAGSIVTKSVEANSIVAGNPAKFIKYNDEKLK